MIGRLAASFPPGHGGLSEIQVDAVVAALDRSQMTQGRIGPATGQNVVSEIRSGSVQWLGADVIGEPIFSHLYTLAVVANRELGWGFLLEGITPMIQATEYDADGEQHYSWHMDWGLGPTRKRKIGIVAHLSDEAGFQGGRLQLTNGTTPMNANQAKGTVTVFPSFVMHRVTPVTQGVRHGAVAWALGPSFR